MKKPLACLEITSESIKMLVGYEEEGKPIPLYAVEKPIPGIIRNGTIADQDALISALSSFHKITDEHAKLNMSICEICLVLPPIEFSVYEADESTNTVKSDNQIQELDISNVIGLVRKKRLPNNDEMVDIIPDTFILDDRRSMATPPLGERSSMLGVHALIHAMPGYIKNQFLSIAARSGFRVKKSCVSSYCNALLATTISDIPTKYVLVDIGGKITSLSLIARQKPFYGSKCFFLGGDHLTQKIVEAFGIPYEIAEQIKKEYGLDMRNRRFERPLFQSESSSSNKIYQKNLNSVIQTEADSFVALLRENLNEIEQKSGVTEKLPLVFTGGGGQLYGLDSLLQNAFSDRPVLFMKPQVVGCRKPGYSALLGLILAASQYTGSLEDNYINVTNVSRVPAVEKNSGKKKRNINKKTEDDVL